MAMQKKIFFLLVTLFCLSACQKMDITEISSYNVNGLVLWQKPLWKVPNNDRAIPLSTLSPFLQFDDKVIVEVTKNEKGGIRCMEVETGNVVWENFFDFPNSVPLDYFSNSNYYFNPEKGFLIIVYMNFNRNYHLNIDINSGEIKWAIPLDSYGAIDGFGDYYYCTLYTSNEAATVYKVNALTGEVAPFFTSNLPPHPDFNRYGECYAKPYRYNNNDYIILSEARAIDYMQKEYFFSLMDANSKDMLITHIPISEPIAKVELIGQSLYIFTSSGYMVLDMQCFQLIRNQRFFDNGEYVYHKFYNGKLILGLHSHSSTSTSGHFIIDLVTSATSKIEITTYTPCFSNGYLYTSRLDLRAYDVNTGRCLLNIPLATETTSGTAAYQNAKGDRFIIASDDKFTYCFPSL
jgi:outer membrane protein assembly factor BamB